MLAELGVQADIRVRAGVTVCMRAHLGGVTMALLGLCLPSEDLRG